MTKNKRSTLHCTAQHRKPHLPSTLESINLCLFSFFIFVISISCAFYFVLSLLWIYHFASAAAVQLLLLSLDEPNCEMFHCISFLKLMNNKNSYKMTNKLMHIEWVYSLFFFLPLAVYVSTTNQTELGKPSVMDQKINTYV